MKVQTTTVTSSLLIHQSALLGIVMLLSSGCMVGPKYQKAPAPVSPAYKETPQGWKQAQPNDGALRGKWWEIYNDPDLNRMEEQVSISNQNVLSAEAHYREAKDAVRVVRSDLFPTLTAGLSITSSRAQSALVNIPINASASGARTIYDLPVDLSYQADVWGGIRHSIQESAAVAQATFAQLENARLSYQSLLAQNYFQLHGSDTEQDLLERTVKSYEEALQLTKDRFDAGVASGADVAEAQTQLDGAQAQLQELGVTRAQYEHAIAVLIGEPPSELSVSFSTIQAEPPVIPVGLPSDLLERRPDIAAAERQMAAANAQIGVVTAAYYPTVTLSASGGLQSSSFTTWLSWPSRFWSVGAQMAETLFDAGRRHAQVGEAQSAYDATVADYRQTVLTGFQQVEDNLAALRVLEEVAKTEQDAIQSAQQALDISTYQYKAGTVGYLQVISAQQAALQAQSAAVSILTRRMVASALLIEALGGGWATSLLPTASDVAKR